VALPIIVSAQNAYTPTYPPKPDIWLLLNTIIAWLFGILLIVAVIFLIIAGFFFITAQGDPDRVKKARDFVLWAIIGILVAFAARGLVWFVNQLVSTSSIPGA